MIGGEKGGIKWGDDLGYEQEKILTTHFDRPFFVTRYPKKAKAFYHKPDPLNPEVTLSVDLLAPEGYGEITGGGQRIEDYDALIEDQGGGLGSEERRVVFGSAEVWQRSSLRVRNGIGG